MVGIDELKQAHVEILELIDVLTVLLHEESLCRMHTVNELYERMVVGIEKHLLDKDKTFSKYLTHENESVRKQVSDFLGGSKTIHNIFNKYRKKWRNFDERCNKHAEFIKDSEEFFDFMKKRIQDDEVRCHSLLNQI